MTPSAPSSESEIAAVRAGSRAPAARDAEIDTVFDSTLRLIRFALACYRFRGEDFPPFLRDLRAWFHRLVQRVNNDRTPVAAFREYLLMATCQFARAHQLARSTGTPTDERLTAILARDPRVLAGGLQKILRTRKEVRGSQTQ
jgi:hypothetical protein